MSSDLPTLATSLLTRCVDLARDAVLLDCLGAVTGPNGSGKTIALRGVVSRYPGLGLDGFPLYHRACGAQGSTRGVKDLLHEAFGVREAHVSSSNLQIACKLGLREFSNRKIKLLLLDEADSLARDSLIGVTTLIDYCNGHGHRIGLIMAAAQSLNSWMGTNAAGMSRTVRCIESSNMSVEEMLGVFSEWLPGLQPLIVKVKEKDGAALKMARLIHRGCQDGNFRRMSYFAKILRDSQAYDEAAIKAAIAKIVLLPSK
jgi:hypothetical protein